MNPLFIGHYFYTYGMRDNPNRKLDFYQINDQAIEARVSAYVDDKWEDAGSLSEDCIWVEAESTTEKTNRLARDRQLGIATQFLPDTAFSEISLEKKKTLIRQLQPEGPYRISLANIIGSHPKFETVETIRFYNPY